MVDFVIIGAVVLTPIAVSLGLYHMKRTGAFEADASVSTEANPYIYKVVPGKEEEVFIPLWMLTAKALVRLLDEQKIMPLEEKKRFEEAIEKAEKLMAGRPVGAKK